MFKVSVIFVLVYFASEIHCNLFLVKTKDKAKPGDDYFDSEFTQQKCACSMVKHPHMDFILYLKAFCSTRTTSLCVVLMAKIILMGVG